MKTSSTPFCDLISSLFVLLLTLAFYQHNINVAANDKQSSDDDVQDGGFFVDSDTFFTISNAALEWTVY